MFVYDINPQQAKQVAAYGGVACSSSVEVARQADLITVVPKSEHSLAVYKYFGRAGRHKDMRGYEYH